MFSLNLLFRSFVIGLVCTVFFLSPVRKAHALNSAWEILRFAGAMLGEFRGIPPREPWNAEESAKALSGYREEVGALFSSSDQLDRASTVSKIWNDGPSLHNPSDSFAKVFRIDVEGTDKRLYLKDAQSIRHYAGLVGWVIESPESWTVFNGRELSEFPKAILAENFDVASASPFIILHRSEGIQMLRSFFMIPDVARPDFSVEAFDFGRTFMPTGDQRRAVESSREGANVDYSTLGNIHEFMVKFLRSPEVVEQQFIRDAFPPILWNTESLEADRKNQGAGVEDPLKRFSHFLAQVAKNPDEFKQKTKVSFVWLPGGQLYVIEVQGMSEPQKLYLRLDNSSKLVSWAVEYEDRFAIRHALGNSLELDVTKEYMRDGTNNKLPYYQKSLSIYAGLMGLDIKDAANFKFSFEDIQGRIEEARVLDIHQLIQELLNVKRGQSIVRASAGVFDILPKAVMIDENLALVRSILVDCESAIEGLQ